MTDVPHFDLPFRLKGASFAVVEQDSVDDIVNCVRAVVQTPVGGRKELPDFGTTDLAFKNQPIDPGELINQIMTNEPRANILADQNLQQFNEMAVALKLNVSVKQEDVPE